VIAPPSSSFQTLPNALADHVGRDRLKTKTPVTHLDLTAAGATRKGDWTVSYSGRVGKEESRHFDAVLVTVSAIGCYASVDDFECQVLCWIVNGWGDKKEEWTSSLLRETRRRRAGTSTQF
jgi:hypothetical protein